MRGRLGQVQQKPFWPATKRRQSLCARGIDLAFATLLDRAAAARLAGREHDPPMPDFLLTPPPRFPLPGLRMLALSAAYLGYHIADEWR